MAKNEWSVFSLSCGKRYYLTHPLKLLRECKNNLKAAWQRATKGYCAMDWANFNNWFTFVVPRMLRSMADEGMAYTFVEGEEPEKATPERWHEWLHEMADKIAYAGEDTDKENEYAEKFYESALDKQLHNKEYFDRMQELSDKHQQVLKEAMMELVDNWWSLWD